MRASAALGASLRGEGKETAALNVRGEAPRSQGLRWARAALAQLPGLVCGEKEGQAGQSLRSLSEPLK